MINTARARQRRLELGYTLTELAILMRVDLADLSRWEAGVREPRTRHVVTWARHLQLDPGDLLVAGEPSES